MRKLNRNGILVRWKKMNDLYFRDVTQIGDLYLEHVFYSFESEPILFVCSDKLKRIYLCLCADIRYEQKWIIAKCNVSIMKSLIEEQVDIATVFLNSPQLIVVIMDLQGQEKSYILESGRVDRLDLPEEGAFLKCDKEKANTFIWNKEWEILCAKINAAIDTTPILDKIEREYSAIFSTSFNMLNKQFDVYKEYICKTLFERLEEVSEALRQSVINDTVSYNYEIEQSLREEDVINVDDVDNDDYLQAA